MAHVKKKSSTVGPQHRSRGRPCHAKKGVSKPRRLTWQRDDPSAGPGGKLILVYRGVRKVSLEYRISAAQSCPIPTKNVFDGVGNVCVARFASQKFPRLSSGRETSY